MEVITRQPSTNTNNWEPSESAKISQKVNGYKGCRQVAFRETEAEASCGDAESWPSESDVTIVRMRLRAAASAPLSLSMVNLARARPRSPACSDLLPPASARARLAKFLRLYFCPCCACLYEMEMEKGRDEASFYLTNGAQRSEDGY